jgi:hypothetical protein
VVLHREDVIEYNDDGSERGRLLGQGDPIEFPTRRRGYYSWHSFCKTQYAGNPKLGGEANFLKAHLSLKPKELRCFADWRPASASGRETRGE